MNQKLWLRRGIDLVMAILLPIQMAYSLIGELSHEITGTVLLLLFTAHHVLNRRWFGTLGKGKYTPTRVLTVSVNALLTIMMVLLPVSGILLSKHLYTFLPAAGLSAAARVMHVLAAYWGFCLMCFHVGLHWNAMLSAMRKGKPVPRIWTAAGLTVMAYGVYAFIARQLPVYMFLRSEFVFFDYSEPIFRFLLDYVSIMVLFAGLGSYALKGCNRLGKKKK